MMDTLIACSLFILLFVLALPTINQLVACLRVAPEPCENDGAGPDRLISRNIRIGHTPSRSTHSTTL